MTKLEADVLYSKNLGQYKHIVYMSNIALNSGKELAIYPQWRQDKESFVKWAQANGSTLTNILSRINRDDGYHPGNCIFVEHSDNACLRNPNANKTYPYVGVRKEYLKYHYHVKYKGVVYKQTGFETMRDAVIARDKFIVDNGLPHHLQTHLLSPEDSIPDTYLSTQEKHKVGYTSTSYTGIEKRSVSSYRYAFHYKKIKYRKGGFATMHDAYIARHDHMVSIGIPLSDISKRM